MFDDPVAMQASLGQVRKRIGVRYIIHHFFDTLLGLPFFAGGTKFTQQLAPGSPFLVTLFRTRFVLLPGSVKK